MSAPGNEDEVVGDEEEGDVALHRKLEVWINFLFSH